MLQRLSKVSREITRGGLPGASRSRVCVCVCENRVASCLISSAAQPASFTREALNMDAKEWNCVHDKTLTHVSVRNMAEYVQTYVRSDGLFVSRGGQYGERRMQV